MAVSIPSGVKQECPQWLHWKTHKHFDPPVAAFTSLLEKSSGKLGRELSLAFRRSCLPVRALTAKLAPCSLLSPLHSLHFDYVGQSCSSSHRSYCWKNTHTESRHKQASQQRRQTITNRTPDCCWCTQFAVSSSFFEI